MLLKGNCLELLAEMPDNSVDSIVTDPPYELGFMGKSWDNSGIAYSVELWSQALRVLKPGGHLLAFGGSRTYHRLASAVEDAGFEIRDQIMYLYGSGFPKSLDVSKAIDKAAGAERPREAPQSRKEASIAIAKNGFGADGWSPQTKDAQTKDAQTWQGWGTALKPAHEPIVVARKPLISTVATNVLTYGTGAMNIDGSRVGTTDNFDGLKGRPITKLATRREGETDEEYKNRVLESPGQQEALAKLKDLGRWPANVIHDGSEEVLARFPNTKGGTAVRGKSGGNTFGGDNPKPPLDDIGYGDSGSAARFFYCAKASRSERNAGLEGLPEKPGGSNAKGYTQDVANGLDRNRPVANFHPTVKPIALMRYLVKLVTPPNGTVLDPFLGSGTTAVAAILEGFNWMGCEMTEDYWPIIEARVAWAEAQPKTLL